MSTRYVGSRVLSVRDDFTGVTFPAWVMYPTSTPSQSVAFGPYTADVSPDAPIDDGRFPVVVISHGTGGSHYLYRTLAAHLAKNGYVVAQLEHPGNNRNDNSLADTDANLVNRPRHMALVIDAVADDAALGDHVIAEQVAAIGHSIGGYTALAVAGGKPWSRTGQQLETVHDTRVKALVLLAPVAFWYVPDGSLANVTAPILVYGGDEDTFAPTWHAHLILAQVPDKSKVTYRLIPKAGHYSFLSPFPPSMAKPTFPPSVDPPGFDREAFHSVLNPEVLAFLDRALRRDH